MAQGGSSSVDTSATSVDGGSAQTVLYPRSPPKAEVDESPLQKSMDRNKESLKVKLMLRRPINQLVAQGIMPQLKTSPTIHEQRQKLERAKMGDLLKAKIQQRPDRQELVRQHILEADVGHVDPSLAERQRMLKKCRLVDSLNDQLSHRPGPLELIKKNILHTEEPIERAVKEGHIEFKATSEGQKIKPEPPDHYMTIDDDSQSSDALSPNDGNSLYNVEMSSPSSSSGQPMQTIITPMDSSADLFRHTGSDMLKTAAAQAGIMTVMVTPNASILATAPSPLSLGSSTSSLSPLSSIASPSSMSCSNGNAFACSSPVFTTPKPSLPVHQQQPAPGKDKNRKKSKSKTQQQKTRTIKFHEYKGPPSAQKSINLNSTNSNTNSSSNSETSYELLLQQQQLFLQWQLEWQQKYPQILLPAVQQKVTDQNPSSPSVISLSSPSPTLSSQQAMDQSCSPPATPPPPPPLPPPPPPPLPTVTNKTGFSSSKPLRNLEDMKVSDLKAELKKRNLRVSGAKTHLIERLKPYAESGNANTSSNQTNQTNVQTNVAIPLNDDSIPDSSVPSPMPVISQSVVVNSVEQMESFSKPSSPQNQNLDTCVNKVTSSAELNSINNNNVEQSDEYIIREQQRKIEELQKQLLNSQLLLQQQRQQQQQLQQHVRSSQTFQPQQAINAKANLAAFLQQQQLNQALAQQQQKLQKQIQQQQLQMQQAVLNNNNNSNSYSIVASNNRTGQKHNVVGDNLNVIKNVNNNIVIKNKKSNNCVSANTGNTNGRQRSNTVILGDHPAALLLNHMIKSEGHHQRTTSLPNFVGTFVQPHLVLSGHDMKQLVSEFIVPEQIKVQNGFLNGSVITATKPDATVTSSNDSDRVQDVKPGVVNSNDNIVGSSQQILLDDDHIVTLHIGEDDHMIVNEYDAYSQQDEISKLFKQKSRNDDCVEDVLNLLIKNGEFNPPESESIVENYTQSLQQQQLLQLQQQRVEQVEFQQQHQKQQQQQHQQQQQLRMQQQQYTPVAVSSHQNVNAINLELGSIYSSSNIDPSIPSQHLSPAELGIDMETFPMDLSDEHTESNVQTTEFMDVDSDWLDRLISSELNHSAANASTLTSNYESLLNNNLGDPLDLFNNIDDNDIKIAAEFSWDRVDFTT